jgi:hypothetical protein
MPKSYTNVYIVFFHMGSTRAKKSNNKLGSATWVLGKNKVRVDLEMGNFAP